MRTHVTTTVVLLCLTATGACASAPPHPPQSPDLLARHWRCDGKDPKDTIIPVVLEKNAKGECHAAVVPSGSDRPRVCVGNKAIWQVTNKCGRTVRVTFAFNPFTKDVGGSVDDDKRSHAIRSKLVRPNARETAGNYPPYKYDILLDDVIDVDPEIEIEYRRR